MIGPLSYGLTIIRMSLSRCFGCFVLDGLDPYTFRQDQRRVFVVSSPYSFRQDQPRGFQSLLFPSGPTTFRV